MMKSVFKTGVLATINGNNQFGNQFKYFLQEREYSEREAKSAIARQIATVVYGVMKNNNKYDPLMNIKSRREKSNDINKNIDL